MFKENKTSTSISMTKRPPWQKGGGVLFPGFLVFFIYFPVLQNGTKKNVRKATIENILKVLMIGEGADLSH